MKFETVRGMRDFLPEQAAKKQWIEDTCRRVFERYGFVPLETPVVEDFGLLAAKGGAGEAIKEEIYYFRDKGERELGLRFDLTVPLARVAAANRQLAMPFKRYAMGTVYRYDRPQQKRYREFTQSDWDILGSDYVLADFEIIAVAIDVMKELGFKEGDFRIKINDRALLEEIAEGCGVEKDKILGCFRCLDKLDKIGETGVKKELEERGITTRILEQIKIKKIEELNPKNKDSAGKLQQLMTVLKSNELDKFVELDLGLARGLEYYTGIVFEIKLKEGPSVGAGGRYDKLVEKYGGQPTPAVGGSFGVDRLLDCIIEKGAGKEWAKSKTKVFVAPIYKVSGDKIKTLRLPDSFLEMESYITLVATKIRRLGINCEMDLMMRNISRTLEGIGRRGIPLVVIVGEEELKKKEVTIKDLERKKQERIKFSDLEQELKSRLK